MLAPIAAAAIFTPPLRTHHMMHATDFIVSPITPADNAALAHIVRSTLVEFHVSLAGTVYFDATTDDLYALFQTPGAAYFVARKNDVVMGGCGIYPTDGLPAATCELVKMYLRPEARRQGLGRRLIEESLTFAKSAGYKNIYLETMPELQQAQHVYRKFGFDYLTGPLGNSGHDGCSVWMLKKE